MSTTSPGRWVALISLASCLAACGCGGGSEKLYPIKGKVRLGATELKAGAVTFIPDAAKKNTTKNSPSGSISSDGTYTVFTDGRPGAPAGWYKVTVSTQTPGGMGGTNPELNKGGTSSAGPVTIHSKYADPAKTDLAVEVGDTPKPDQYDLKVAR